MLEKQTTVATSRRCCGRCIFFDNSPATIEAAFPGLSTMSSGSASVKAQDGLCNKHDLYLSFHDVCPAFQVVVRS